ncbi:uncharacterized protein J7T54_003280 [Emericellopsis cladophorae]|uniref:Uncharacterized protein n=1 Tax=Emericellopsis cladophorae TaxID=2686198 RepID=A0A9Q0BCS4_9HYPO|nr:uncharacterized protein J7T54_003280 [Emericellopsis cladophorae]KAI6781112.1 hypothetical protein J7T54_003280 [Emericellopsis cladophorae]
MHEAKLAYEDAKEHLKKTQDDTKDLEACFAEILKATGVRATDTIEQQPTPTTDAVESSKLDERLGAIAREQEARIKKLESDLQTRFNQSITDSAKRIQEDFDKSLKARTEEIKGQYTAMLEERDKRTREHYDRSLESRTEEIQSQCTAKIEENDKRIREHYDETLKTYMSNMAALREQVNKWQEIDLDNTKKQASIMKLHEALAAKVQGAANELKRLSDHVRKLDERLSLPPKPDTTDRAISELKTKLQNLEDKLSASAQTGETEKEIGSLKNRIDVLEQSSAPQRTALTLASRPNSPGLDPDLDKIQYAVDQIKMDLHTLKKNVVEIFQSQSLIPAHLKDWARMATPTRQHTPLPQVQAASDGALATAAHVETTRRHLEELYKDKESFVDSVVACIGPRVGAEIAEIQRELISKGDSITSCQGDINACKERIANVANDLNIHRSLHGTFFKYCKDVHEDLDMRCRNLDHWQQNFETTDLVKQMTEYIKALMPGEMNQMRHKVAAIETELRRIQDHASKKRKVALPNGGTQAVPMAPVHPS